MKQLRKFIFCIFVLLVLLDIRAIAQQANKEPEVGVVEHLDEMVPLDLKFTNDSNQTITLKQLIDKPTVLVLVYFDCPGICPAILSGVSSVIESADLELGKDYQVLTVSFNDADNTEKAAKMKKNFLGAKAKLHPEAWKFLTGDSANINALAKAVGFKFKKTGLDFIHPSVIEVLSPQGKITRYLYGTRFLPFDLKMAIIEAQKGLSRPTVNRVLEFCFNYDPVGKKYVLDVTRIAGIVILFFAVLFLAILLISTRKRKNKINKSKD